VKRLGGRRLRAPGKETAALEALGSLPQRAFFEPPVEQVAPCLLGKVLVHRTASGILAGRIVEVEAYLGPHNRPPDPAAHSYRGPTPRNRVLFGPAGFAYVYAIYGRYFCMNVCCEPEGQAGCILVRALEPVGAEGIQQMALNRGVPQDAAAHNLTSGPSRLCQALSLTRPLHNGLDLLDPASPLQLRDDGFGVREMLVTPRIGIKQAVDWPLRFALPNHDCVSGPKNWPKSGLKKMKKGSVGRSIFLG
jgi:DNA-3-methyladenine glycosylase